MHAALIVALTGCSWSSKPYAQDPLVQKKRAVPGEVRMVPDLCEADHPAPPTPPAEQTAAPHSK